MSIPLIQVQDLCKTYGDEEAKTTALCGANFTIEKGEFVSIMGPSGSGKSTLMQLLGLLDRPTDGKYFLEGKDTENFNDDILAVLRNKKLGFVFQSFNLISFKNALENVSLPLYYQGISRKKRNKIAMEYLDKMGLRDWANHLPSELSGGQKQRVAIARSLITQPKVILADEPTGALDSETSYEVMNILKEVNKQGMTVIIVTHEKDISEMTRRIIRLRDGIIEGDILLN